jgi:hypothetical protein
LVHQAGDRRFRFVILHPTVSAYRSYRYSIRHIEREIHAALGAKPAA